MARKRFSDEEKIDIIMKCRRSGLSDYQWCDANAVNVGTFYNWVSKLRKKGYTIPDSSCKNKAEPTINEVVKLNVIDEINSETIIEQNTNQLVSSANSNIAAEVILPNLTLRLYNGADEIVIRNILGCVGGDKHAW